MTWIKSGAIVLPDHLTAMQVQVARSATLCETLPGSSAFIAEDERRRITGPVEVFRLQRRDWHRAAPVVDE